MKFRKRMGQAISRHRLRHSGNDEQVTAFGHFLEVRYRRVRLGVHNDMLKVAVTSSDGSLLFVHHLKRQALPFSALAPFDRGTDSITVHQKGGGEALEISSQM